MFTLDLKQSFRPNLEDCDVIVYIPISNFLDINPELSAKIRKYGYERNWINLSFFIDRQNNIIEAGYFYPLSAHLTR